MTRRHLTGIRYAVTVELDPDESAPSIGHMFGLDDMGVVRVVAVRDPTRQRTGTAGDRDHSMTVETLETIGRLVNVT